MGSRPQMRKPSLATQILAVNAAADRRHGGRGDRRRARCRSRTSCGRRQALVLVAGILAVVLVNGIVLRRRFAPLEKLIDVMERIDLARPGVRAEVPEADSDDVIRLVQALQPDARPPRGRAVAHRRRRAAGPGERARAPRARPARRVQPGADRRPAAPAGDDAATRPRSIRAELRDTKEVATTAMDELLRLARELRPTALDDHGLQAALRTQVERFSDQTGVPRRAARSTTSSPTCPTTSRPSSTASCRSRCRTSRGTPRPRTSWSRSAATTAGRSCASPTTASASRRATPGRTASAWSGMRERARLARGRLRGAVGARARAPSSSCAWITTCGSEAA